VNLTHCFFTKTKKLTKIVGNKNTSEEEKIMAFKEKVYVHDKTLSLYNNFLIKDYKKDEFSKTHKPRLGSAYHLTNKKTNNSKHYMMPKQKDLLKQKKIKEKEIIYYNDKPEFDSDEIKIGEN